MWFPAQMREISGVWPEGEHRICLPCPEAQSLGRGVAFFHLSFPELDKNSGPSPGPGVPSSLSSGSLAEKTQVQATDQARS